MPGDVMSAYDQAMSCHILTRCLWKYGLKTNKNRTSCDATHIDGRVMAWAQIQARTEEPRIMLMMMSIIPRCGAFRLRKRLTSMAFIPVPSCVQARMLYLNGETNSVAQNVFYFATDSVPTMPDLEEINDLISAWALEDWCPLSTVFWQMTGVSLRGMNTEEGLSLNSGDGWPRTGTAAGAGLPNQVTYTITWSSGLVGRSARGRSYGVGIPTSGLATYARLDDTYRAAAEINWNALRSVMETEGHAMQIISFSEGGVPRAEGRALPVLGCNVRFPLATQRRRLS